MISKHLSDADIQQYVSDKTYCGADTIAHILECEHCRAKAETYRLIFSGIKQQPKPSFDFDLSGLILTQISPAKPAFLLNSLQGYLVAIIAVAVFGMGGYMYRAHALRLFKKYILSIVSGISPVVISLVITTALTILIFQSIELFKKYQRKIDDLNFY